MFLGKFNNLVKTTIQKSLKHPFKLSMVSFLVVATLLSSLSIVPNNPLPVLAQEQKADILTTLVKDDTIKKQVTDIVLESDTVPSASEITKDALSGSQNQKNLAKEKIKSLVVGMVNIAQFKKSINSDLQDKVKNTIVDPKSELNKELQKIDSQTSQTITEVKEETQKDLSQTSSNATEKSELVQEQNQTIAEIQKTTEFTKAEAKADAETLGNLIAKVSEATVESKLSKDVSSQTAKEIVAKDENTKQEVAQITASVIKTNILEIEKGVSQSFGDLQSQALTKKSLLSQMSNERPFIKPNFNKLESKIDKVSGFQRLSQESDVAPITSSKEIDPNQTEVTKLLKESLSDVVESNGGDRIADKIQAEEKAIIGEVASFTRTEVTVNEDGTQTSRVVDSKEVTEQQKSQLESLENSYKESESIVSLASRIPLQPTHIQTEGYQPSLDELQNQSPDFDNVTADISLNKLPKVSGLVQAQAKPKQYGVAEYNSDADQKSLKTGCNSIYTSADLIGFGNSQLATITMEVQPCNKKFYVDNKSYHHAMSIKWDTYGKSMEKSNYSGHDAYWASAYIQCSFAKDLYCGYYKVEEKMSIFWKGNGQSHYWLKKEWTDQYHKSAVENLFDASVWVFDIVAGNGARCAVYVLQSASRENDPRYSEWDCIWAIADIVAIFTATKILQIGGKFFSRATKITKNGKSVAKLEVATGTITSFCKITNVDKRWVDKLMGSVEVRAGSVCGIAKIFGKNGQILGKNGTKTASTTLTKQGSPIEITKKAKIRIDVENPNPGKLDGNLHLQNEANNNAKYLFNPQDKKLYYPKNSDGMLIEAEESIQKWLENTEIRKQINKGLTSYLGELSVF
jgi:hypothetical protein